jgi:glyoxylase I family protein
MDNAFKLEAILHASIIVENTERALQFYHEILGVPVNNQRPDLGYPGAWLQIGMQQIHLLELDNPDPVDGRPQHGGRDRHIAIAVDNITALQNRLDKAGVKYTLSKSGRRALFARDPDGNACEFIENV